VPLPYQISQHPFITNLKQAIENYSPELVAHSERTKAFAYTLIKQMLTKKHFYKTLMQNDYPSIIEAIAIHDIGKTKIATEIFSKPDRLSDHEYMLMQNHVVFGKGIIYRTIGNKDMDSVALQNCLDVVIHHHEWYDGKGYMQGLKGTHIPLPARIAAIVDVYDALVHERCYKGAMTHKQALDAIMCECGTHFDPKIAEVFFEVSHTINEENLSFNKAIKIRPPSEITKRIRIPAI